MSFHEMLQYEILDLKKMIKKSFQTYPIQVEYNLSCGADICKKAKN